MQLFFVCVYMNLCSPDLLTDSKSELGKNKQMLDTDDIPGQIRWNFIIVSLHNTEYC